METVNNAAALSIGDIVRCNDKEDMIDTITDLFRCGYEVRIIARWTLKAEERIGRRTDDV